MFNSFSRYQPQLLGILRIVAGLLFLSHGLVKLFGFPDVPPGQQELLTLSGIGGLIELVAGALIMIGLFTRPAAFIAAGEMAVAYWGFHFTPDSPFPVGNGGDAAILYCFVFLYFVVAGPGAFSVERPSRAGVTRT
jgi:putative oxidoreductase